MVKKTNQGYSLVEVMVAMVGISLVVLLLASVLISSIRSANSARDRDYALMAAKAKMNELTAMNITLQNALTLTELNGTDDFAAPNGKEYRRIWRTITGNPPVAPFFIEVRALASENDTIRLVNYITPKHCDASLFPGRPQITTIHKLTDNSDIEIFISDINSIFFTANPAPADVERAGNVVIESARLNNGANNKNLVKLNGKNISGNLMELPALKNNDKLDLIIYFENCAGEVGTLDADRRTQISITFKEDVFDPAKTHNVIYHCGGGSVCPANQSNVSDGTEINKPNDLTKAGYKFLRWSQTENGAAATFPIVVNSDINLYAVWEAEAQCEFSGVISAAQAFNMNNSSSGQFAVSHNITSNSAIAWSVSSVVPASSGFTFDGTNLRVQSGVSANNYAITLQAAACNTSISGVVNVNVSQSATPACEITGDILPTSFSLLHSASAGWSTAVSLSAVKASGGTITWSVSNNLTGNYTHPFIPITGRLLLSGITSARTLMFDGAQSAGTYGINITANCGSASKSWDMIVVLRSEAPISCGDNQCGYRVFCHDPTGHLQPLFYNFGERVVYDGIIYEVFGGSANRIFLPHQAPSTWRPVGCCPLQDNCPY